MERMTVRALRVVLPIVFAVTVFVEVGLLWVLVSGSDPEDGSVRLLALRVLTIVGVMAVQVGLWCVWRLASLVSTDAIVANDAVRHVDRLTGAIVAVALVWFAVTAVNAPEQREDPGVTLIMAGIGVGILGIALVVRLLRTLLVRAGAARPGRGSSRCVAAVPASWSRGRRGRRRRAGPPASPPARLHWRRRSAWRAARRSAVPRLRTRAPPRPRTRPPWHSPRPDA